MLVALAAVVVMVVHPVDPSGERWTMKPVSLLELSVQVRLTWSDVVDAEAARLLGAVGGGTASVVALETLELLDAPILLTAPIPQAGITSEEGQEAGDLLLN